jgi:hypothetical protein
MIDVHLSARFLIARKEIEEFARYILSTYLLPRI